MIKLPSTFRMKGIPKTRSQLPNLNRSLDVRTKLVKLKLKGKLK